jgi:prepilin-type N-terminal cleavage/methylation domain-containing protein
MGSGFGMKGKHGFSLIELLVVIAIIAILAAIIFPVFARVKVSANRSSDMTNMNSIRTALQLYRADQGAYPPALLGYVTLYSDGPGVGTVIPANLVKGTLYPKRVESVQTFRPAPLRASTGVDLEREITTAVWPSNLNPGGVAGDARQRFAWPSTTDPVTRCVDGAVIASEYYAISGYDVAKVTDGLGTRTELRYSPFWSGWTVAANPCAPLASEQGSASDDPRQLGYSDPPDETVVTWNSFYREVVAGVPQSGRSDMVLFLGGGARAYDGRALYERAWQVRP